MGVGVDVGRTGHSQGWCAATIFTSSVLAPSYPSFSSLKPSRHERKLSFFVVLMPFIGAFLRKELGGYLEASQSKWDILVSPLFFNWVHIFQVYFHFKYCGKHGLDWSRNSSHIGKIWNSEGLFFFFFYHWEAALAIMANSEHKTVKTIEVWFQEIESSQRETVQHSYPFQLLSTSGWKAAFRYLLRWWRKGSNLI